MLGTRERASSGASGRDSAAASPTIETPPGSVSADAVKKLDQIIQNFHTKAASLVLQSRLNLKPIYTARGSGNKKLNKWFQIETEEFDDFKEELRIWRNCGSFENKPMPLIIETYLDTSRLTPSQSLVIVDENGRLSFGGASKAGDDEQGSSGRQSLSSSVAQPGSGLLAEASAGGSSGSLQTDDDQISEFLKALDSKKTLKSFESGKKGEGATNRTVAQLSRFHLMKESNQALTDSMTSSMQMQRSSSSSSRQLSNVPSMAAPASVSVSSSPGKPLSPHTPHTPAVPSRLSENSIINYNISQPRSDRTNPSAENTQMPREDTITQDGTTAIDIPISPRIGTHPRRSSSVAQQNRAMADDEDGDLAFAANRSISLGAEDREPPTLSMLLGRQTEAESASRRAAGSLQPTADIPSSGSAEMMRQGSSEGSKPPGGLMAVAPSSSPFGRRRYAGMASTGGRGQTPPQSSRGSFTGSIGRYGRGENDLMDEEPLLFDMSEMDAQSRRSLEEGRGGGNIGSGSGSRADFEPRGISRRGW
ncbi:hypothetical protein COL516b_011667 [Colletotrichum fioriniae]|nr:uncharacterized protein COL516b_011667 [Colletotrichum fioriniae]KAJ0296384.1 hypothetical protein COL516b_011667 [Colletotrichum fioriniae]